MSAIEITPELMADIEQKAKAANPAEINEPVFYASQATGCYPEPCDLYFWTHDNPPEEIGQIYSQRFSDYYAVANPAVMLAMIERIRQLEAAQCWVIAAIDTDKAAFGPFFEKNDAEYRMDSMPTEFAKKHKIRLCKGGE